MPQVGERAKTVHALDRAATVVGRYILKGSVNQSKDLVIFAILIGVWQNFHLVMSYHVRLLPIYFHFPFAFLSRDTKMPYTSYILAHSFSILDVEAFAGVTAVVCSLVYLSSIYVYLLQIQMSRYRFHTAQVLK
jgi:flagellar biosynthesis protein FlhB